MASRKDMIKELIADIDFILSERPQDLFIIALFFFVEIASLIILWWAL